MSQLSSQSLTKKLGIRYPIICGAMYPCSNPELIAAVSEAGGIGIVQPLSLVYVYGLDLKAGLQKIKALTQKPWGFNVLTEQSSKIYQERMSRWVDVALEEGCRFFISALGNPKWIVERVKPFGGIVFHDVTELKWAQKAVGAGVHGLICVNNRAGGHAGTLSQQELFERLSRLNLPLVCAGGVGDAEAYLNAMSIGYSAVQFGTRFIATTQCQAHEDYKQAILRATPDDIVLTERLTGVPVSVIQTEAVKQIGTRAGPVAKWMLQHPRFKHWARLWYSLNSFRQLKKSFVEGNAYKDYWQAGKSVGGIDKIEDAQSIVKEIGASLEQAWKQSPDRFRV